MNSPHPKQDSSRSSTFTGQANTHGGQVAGIPSPQILAPILTINLMRTDNKLIIGKKMKAIILVSLFFLLSCGNNDLPVREDKERPCYDECDKNADCAVGLACSEQAGHVCIPIRCVECWAVSGRVCLIAEDYSSGDAYPVCTYEGCNE